MTKANEGTEAVVKKLKPPYPSPGHADKLFDLFRRITPQKIDTKFVADNGITTRPNASNVVKLAEWLGIVDQNGIVIPAKINKLKLAGEERNKYIVEMIKTSYKDLFEHVDLQSATRDDVINYFIHNHDFGSRQAEYAAILFLHLCQVYGIPMADKLKRKVYAPREKSQTMNKAVRGAPAPTQEPSKQNNTMTMIVEGKRHDFDLQSQMDKALFNTLSQQLLKIWGKKGSQEDDTDDSPEDDKGRG
jgi:hypothetical protein